MIVNLFDSNFQQSVCSTAWATPQNIQYTRGQMDWKGVTLFTDGWIRNPVVDAVRSDFKVAWLHEPKCLHPDAYEFDTRWNKFNAMLSYSKQMIFDYNALFCIYGGVWVPRDQWGLHTKHNLVSMLYGDKVTTQGHQLRHLIGEMFPVEKSGIQYFGHKGIKTDYSQNTKLRVLKPYMFSIVTETCRENWLFTEILLDCFALGTVPIFWGCPEIGTFFEERGILSFETLPELQDILKTISPSLYHAMLPYAAENLKRVAEYACTEDWMYHHILRRFE